MNSLFVSYFPGYCEGMSDRNQHSPNIQTVTLPPSDLLSERELARLLGKSLRTIRRWSVERRGPRKVKLGKSVFYRRESLLRWIATQEEGANHDPCRDRSEQRQDDAPRCGPPKRSPLG